MSITVYDTYQLSCMKNIRIVTGTSGMNRPVKRMGILDYEYISYKIEGDFLPDDFVLCSFLFAKDDPSLFEAGLRAMIDLGVSILGIKDVYYKDIPRPLLDYAIEKNCSIFFFGFDLYFETIILEVGDALRVSEDNRLLEIKIDNLINNQLSPSAIRTLALEINRSFLPKGFAVYLRSLSATDPGALFRLMHRLTYWERFQDWDSAIQYKNGLLLVMTFNENEKIDPRAIVAELQSALMLPNHQFSIGISRIFSQLTTLDKALQESLFAAKTAAIENRQVISYDQIGLYQAILPCSHTYWMEQFRDRIIQPLQEYDDRCSADLLPTLFAYVDCEGNIRAAAERLFQHENTVRYRINRIRELLSLTDDHCQFYTQACLAVTLHRASQFR